MCLPALPLLGLAAGAGGAIAAGASTATVLGAASLGLTAGSHLQAGRDAKKAYNSQADIALADAQHRKQVAEYNAMILRDQALRLRNDQVSRLNEVAGINIGRIEETSSMNLQRLQETAGINISRVTSSAGTNISRIKEDALITSARIQEAADINVRRLEDQAVQTMDRSIEDENAIRRVAAETISEQRAFYGARNVVIDSGTPAALQIDTARMAEVDRLRVRRNYRLQAKAILDRADDIKREAAYQIGDISRVSAYQISDINRNVEDQVYDITRELGYTTSDITRQSQQQLDDIRRSLGYDVSDIEFEADKLDQEAALVILQGDAALAGGLNRSEALRDAGTDALTSSILSAAGSVISGVDPKWLSKSSSAVNSVGPLKSGYVVSS